LMIFESINNKYNNMHISTLPSIRSVIIIYIAVPNRSNNVNLLFNILLIIDGNHW